jgi:hypothetical protein
MHPSVVPVPVPDAVALLIGSQVPVAVLHAEMTAVEAATCVTVCRGEQYREAREYNLGRLAAANKTLAAHDPRLVIRPGGAL